MVRPSAIASTGMESLTAEQKASYEITLERNVHWTDLSIYQRAVLPMGPGRID